MGSREKDQQGHGTGQDQMNVKGQFSQPELCPSASLRFLFGFFEILLLARAFLLAPAGDAWWC